MRTKMTNVADLLKMGHGQVVPEVVVRVVNACRPYKQTERDKEFRWHRQLLKLEGGDGLFIPMVVYSDKMHLGSENEGQVWRFRCLPSEGGGPRGLEVNKWQKTGSQEINVELKLNAWADAGRLSFLEGPQEPEPAKPKQEESKPATPEVAPAPMANDKTNPDEVEELVMADIIRRREFGREKYKTTMERTDIDLRGWLQHRYEEILDDAIYTRRAIRDLCEGALVLVPADELARLRDIERQHLDVPAFLQKRDPAQAMSEAPVEKAMRSSKNPKGGDPLREEKEPSREEPAPQEEQTQLPAGEGSQHAAPPRETTVQERVQERKDALDEEFRRNNLKFVALHVRDAYDDDASDDAVERAHSCLKIMKDNRYRWTEVFDVLTAKTKSQSPGLVSKAFYAIKEELNAGRDEKDHRSDEQVAEAICKKPSALRAALDKLQNP